MTFGYNANLFEEVVTSQVVDHSKTLLNELLYMRKDCTVCELVAALSFRANIPADKALAFYRSFAWRNCHQKGLSQPHIMTMC